MSQDTGNPSVAETSSEDIAAPNPRYVRILLVTVILLGVLLVGGAAVVISTVIARLSTPEAPMARDFEVSEIAIPAGARLVEVENGATRIVLRWKIKTARSCCCLTRAKVQKPAVCALLKKNK